MIEMYKKAVFENYANFNGRATRSEYWYFALANLSVLVFLLVFGGILGAIFASENAIGQGVVCGYIIYMLYSLAVMIPGIAVFVRRMHDIDKSGWNFLLAIIPFGAIVLLVFLFTEGTRGTNKYGDDPKNAFEELTKIGKE